MLFSVLDHVFLIHLFMFLQLFGQFGRFYVFLDLSFEIIDNFVHKFSYKVAQKSLYEIQEYADTQKNYQHHNMRRQYTLFPLFIRLFFKMAQAFEILWKNTAMGVYDTLEYKM